MPAPIHSARRSRAAMLGVVALCTAAIAGCGGDDDESPVVATTGPTGPTGPTGATGAAGQAQEIGVSETDFELDPADPTVEAGEVAITATNDSDGTVHGLAVEGPSGEQELPKDLQPGDSGELTVELGEPGEYRWYCPIANHEQLGMVGDITVEG
ncbi:MAG: cupredoxin domain-containing protein [Solirubrobacterales bacterium]